MGFFPEGVLFMACVANAALLAEQRRVQNAVAPLAVGPWPHFETEGWVPHVTLAVGLAPEQLAIAAPLLLDHLPIEGVFDHGGVEDGTTGKSWPARAGA